MQKSANFTVHRAGEADYRKAAELHVRGLPGEFLSLMGTRFLTALYKGINETPGGFVLVAEGEGEVAGFVSGGEKSAPVYQAVIRRMRPQLAFWAGLQILRRPQLIPSVMAAAKHGGETGSYADRAELYSIAAGPRRSGVGRALLAAFNEEMRQRKVDFYHLVVGEDNVNARAFYERNGFNFLERVSMFGSWKHRLGIHLNAN